LRGETLGSGHGKFGAGSGNQGSAGFARNCSLGNVGDCDGLHAAGERLALRGDGVGSLAGLCDHHDDRINRRVRGAIAIFAGILHIDGDAGEIFDHDFAGHAAWRLERWRR